MTNIQAVRVQELHVVRGRNPVLRGLSLSVPAGAITGLLGPSGCGKTTLIRAMAGVQVVESGSVEVLGEPAGSATNRRRVGYVTQASSVFADLTVRQNLAYFADLYGAPRARVSEVVGQVDLTDKLDVLTGDLSGGQRTRVSLAAALLSGCEVLLLDEPTVGLDPVLRRDLWALFHDLAAAGRSLLVSSHVMDEAGRCDHVILMREGELLAQCTPDELRTAAGTDDLEEAFLVLAEGSPA